MEVYTHRGIGLGPEQTHASFTAAAALGINIEADVRKTRDNVLVMFHGHPLAKTTNGTGEIEEKTYAELEELDAGAWYDKAFKSEKIPTFEELLIKYGSWVERIDVEIKKMNKNTPEHNGIDVLRKVEEYDLVDRFLFTSFYPQVIYDIKTNRHPKPNFNAKFHRHSFSDCY